MVNVYESVAAPEVPAVRIGLVYVPITVAPAPAADVALWKMFENVVPVEAVPLLVSVELRVTAVLTVAEVGVTEPAVRFGTAGTLTVIAVHAEQLSLSLLSGMVPTIESLLSAQTRTYFVPPEVNVYESVDGPEAPAVFPTFISVPIDVAPVPDASFAIWKRSVKVDCVEAVPLLVIVELRVTAVPNVATVGVTAPAVRLGAAVAETVTAVHAPQLFISLDSATAVTVSAHTRTYHTPALNVSLMVVFPLAPAASTPCAAVPITAAPVPEASLATWKRFVKPVPVDAVPTFETVELSVTAAPAVAVVGVTVLTVRSGAAVAETVTGVHAPQLSLSFDSAMVPTIEALLSAQART